MSLFGVNRAAIKRPYSFIIYVEDSLAKAFNTATGYVDYSNSNTSAEDTFNSVLSAMNSAGGGLAFVKAGTFTCDGAINALSNTGLIGESREESIIQLDTTSTSINLFQYNSDDPPDNTPLTDFTLENLRLESNVDSSGAGACVYLEDTRYIRFVNNHFISINNPTASRMLTWLSTRGGLVINQYAFVVGNIYEGPTNGQDMCGGGCFVNCYFADNTFIGDLTNGGQGFAAARASHSIWTNNRLYNCGNIIGFEGNAPPAGSDFEFTGCEANIVTNNIGISSAFIKLANVGNSTSNQSYSNIVANNLQMYGPCGIIDGYGVSDVIVNNVIYRSRVNGFQGAVTRSTIANNYFVDTNYTNSTNTINGTPRRQGGIILKNNTSWTGQTLNRIYGNVFIRTGDSFTIPTGFTDGGDSDSGNTGGIHMDTNFDGTDIQTNNFTGTLLTTHVVDRYSDAGTNTKLKNNHGYVTENEGAASSVADGGTISHGLVSTPTVVTAVGSVAGEFVSVTALGSSTFTVAIKQDDGTAGTSQTIYWRASV